MASASARVSRERPFYADHACAYDLLVTDPAGPWADAVHEFLASHVQGPALVLDAGCGTGRHAAALAARGHRVDLADASPALLAQAAARNPASRALHADLCRFTAGTAYQAVTCRGVLNDMTTGAERDAVLRAFANALADGGLLILDVRDRDGSRRRAAGIPRHRTADLGEHGVLRFTSTATWHAGLIRVREQYELRRPGMPPDRRAYDFTMRPWSPRELRGRLGAAGFSNIGIGPGAGRVTGDRLFVTARLGHPAAPRSGHSYLREGSSANSGRGIMSPVHIREASERDLAVMQDIERAAGSWFRDIGMPEIADDEPLSLGELARYRDDGRAWVAADDAGVPAAYLIAGLVDEGLHIEQVSVHPRAARRGIGRMLLEYAASYAGTRGIRALTLTTFTEVPWNAPYYARCGFRILDDTELSPGLRAVRDREAAHGLHRWPRVFMRRDLAAG